MIMFACVFMFFFFKQKTAYEMRISDWSSDVCSSDLAATLILNWIAGGDHAPYYYAEQEGWYDEAGLNLTIEQGKGSQLAAQRVEIGRASCRERVCQYV